MALKKQVADPGDKPSSKVPDPKVDALITLLKDVDADELMQILVSTDSEDDGLGVIDLVGDGTYETELGLSGKQVRKALRTLLASELKKLAAEED